MSEPIQVGEPHFDDDGVRYGPDVGMTYIEFRFERPGKEDFHVKIGKSGNHTDDLNWIRMAEKSAVATASLEHGKA